MSAATTASADLYDRHLRPFAAGLVLALLAALFSVGVGLAFGAAEDSLKQGLEASGQAALADVYGGDEAKMKAVTAKSWSYYKRAHLHAGAMSTAALASIFLLAFVGGPRRLAQLAAIGLGFGALGYGVFWLLAGQMAPGLGGTGAAKEALEWLALPSTGGYALGMLVTLALLVRRIAGGKAQADATPERRAA